MSGMESVGGLIIGILVVGGIVYAIMQLKDKRNPRGSSGVSGFSGSGDNGSDPKSDSK